MKKFEKYYLSDFRTDLSDAIQGIDFKPNHIGDADLALQPLTISGKNGVIKKWTIERQNMFSVALFYTVLIDQVFYTHYGNSYQKFRQMTQYPKFIGDCPGGCRNHLSPSVILRSVGKEEYSRETTIAPEIQLLLQNSTRFFKQEAQDYLGAYAQEIDVEELWEKCSQNIPNYFGY
jgi:hypothetical protein